MKLLNIPSTTFAPLDIITSSGLGRVAGRPIVDNVEIFCPIQAHTELAKDEVWRKLKYGTTQALKLGEKVSVIAFRENNQETILYGVIPIKQTTITSGFGEQDGNVFECRIDHFTIEEI